MSKGFTCLQDKSRGGSRELGTTKKKNLANHDVLHFKLTPPFQSHRLHEKYIALCLDTVSPIGQGLLPYKGSISGPCIC